MIPGHFALGLGIPRAFWLGFWDPRLFGYGIPETGNWEYKSKFLSVPEDFRFFFGLGQLHFSLSVFYLLSDPFVRFLSSKTHSD